MQMLDSHNIETMNSKVSSNNSIKPKINSIGAKIKYIIIGDVRKISLENRVYIVSTFIAFISSILGFLWNYFISLSYLLNVIVGILFVSFVVLYFLARYKNRYYNTVVVFVSQLGFIFTWISSDGSNGSVIPFFLVAIVPFIAISKPRKHFLYLFITIANIGLLYLLENSQYSDIIIKYPDELTRKIDIAFSLIFSLTMLFLFVHIIITKYNKENTLVKTQKKELEKLNDTKDKFFSIIAHDLRGPFIGISELTSLMANESMDLSKEDLVQLSKKLSNTSTKVYVLLENLLNWARLNQGLIKHEPHSISLRMFVTISIEAMMPIAANKSITIKNNIENSINVFADDFMIQTIIRNLVSNAIKFTAKGGMIIINAKKQDDNMVAMSIIDNGVGMSKEIVDNIFNLTEQIRRVGTDNEPSSGLGMPLCNEFVNTHGGEITIESIEGEGSTFVFTIPSVSPFKK